MKSCIQGIGIKGIHDEVAATGIGTYAFNQLPCIAAIGAFVYAAVAAFAPHGPVSCHIYHVAAIWMHNHIGNMLAVFQPHIFPALTSVHAFVHAIAIAHAALVIVFAATYPNDIAVLRIEGYTTNGIAALPIKKRSKCYTVIGCFPNATACCGHIILAMVLRIDGKIGNPS